MDVREAGFYGTVQANHSWSIVAFYTAPIYHGGIYGGIYQHRKDFNGWGATCFVLYEWYYDLELFLFMFKCNLKYVCSQCGNFWKGIFPEVSHATFGSCKQYCKVWYSVFIAPRRHALV